MRRIHVAAGLGIAIVLLLTASEGRAWKPKTHIHLANAAVDEVLNNAGTVVVRDQGSGEVIAELVVPLWLQRALHHYRDVFLAGVIGPDAYPDLATGQLNIHPKIAAALDGSTAPGTDAFLAHLYRESEKCCFAFRTRARVFTRGYLTHAAGDMFMHTLVNHYAGGPFGWSPDGPGPPNGVRHIALEGYVGRRTPSPESPLPSIDGLEGWLYEVLVRSDPGSTLERRLFVDPEGGGPTDALQVGWLIPRFYSALRNQLQARIDRHDALPAGPEKVALGLAVPGLGEWIRAIDEGLREWIRVSRRISDLILYNEEDAKDFAEAEKRLERYAVRHLSAMSGLPEALGVTVTDFAELRQAIVGPYDEMMKGIRERLLAAMVEGVFGHPYAEVKRYFTNPGQVFDTLFTNPEIPGERIDLQTFNERVLGIDAVGLEGDDTFEWRRVAAARNTVTLTQLLLLERWQINCLMTRLEGNACDCSTPPEEPVPACVPDGPMQTDNVMLGFVESLDDSFQWDHHAKGDADEDEVGPEKQDASRKLVLARSDDAYGRVFRDVRELLPPKIACAPVEGEKPFEAFEAGETGQSWVNAYLLSLLSWIAYAPPELAEKCAESWGLTLASTPSGAQQIDEKTWFFVDPQSGGLTGNTQAYVLYNEGAVFVTFRGSTTDDYAQDWIDSDVDFKPLPKPGWGEGVVMHAGFHDAADVSYAEVLRTLEPLREGRRLWITGHSLGGAVATVSAFRMEEEDGIDVQGVHVYGAPAVGNRAWKDRFGRVVGDNVRRWNLEGDPAHQLFLSPLVDHVGSNNNLYADGRAVPDDGVPLPLTLRIVSGLATTHMDYWFRLEEELREREGALNLAATLPSPPKGAW